MKRREFITLLGGAAAAWPHAVRAQQPAMPIIGILSTRPRGGDEYLFAAFRQGLKETGYVEGKNVAVEYRFAENDYNRLPVLATDFVHRQVKAIFAGGSPAGPAAKTTTDGIPIVFTTAADPVAVGLVSSLNRPGANVTGVTTLAEELGKKLLELMHETVPAATIVALLVNPSSSLAPSLSRDAQLAAQRLGLQVRVLHATNERDFNAVFGSLEQLGSGALVIGPDAFFTSRAEQLAALTLRYAIPSMYQFREFAVAGGLISYGASLVDAYRQAGIYIGKILNGSKPADLPVLQPTKFDLVINLKTAKAIGLTVPPPLLARTDEVIE